MDNLFKHLHSQSRGFAASPALISVGLTSKDTKSVVCHGFDTFNLSLILKGEGFYEFRGVRHVVRAPMIILQWPGETMHYGPSEYWEELYLVFPSEAEERFINMGLHQREQWGYPLMLGPEFEGSFSRFVRGLQEDISADRLDLMALELLLLGRGVSDGPLAKSPHPLVAEALSWMKRNLHDHFELKSFCQDRQLSASSFRRFWAETQRQPPHSTFLLMKMNDAAQKLTETSLRISEVALALGFEDPLHFSRRFKSRFGISPRDYRRRYQPNSI